MPPYKRHDTSPGVDGVAVTKHDTNDESRVFRYLQNGNTAGDISFVTPAGTPMVQYAPAGGFVWCAVQRVNSTGTVAGAINGYF